MPIARHLLASAAALVLVTGVATAAPRLLADLTGKWEVSVDTPGGAQPMTMTVDQKADSISGTVESPIGTAPMTGVVKGDSVMFAFRLDMSGQPLTINGAGVIKEQRIINGALDVSGMGAMPFTAVKQP